jgi:GAF domain-containing protein
MISESDVIVVRDAAQDHRFAGDPLLRRSPGVRFYAGAPLTTGDGHAVGVLCVMDLEPRDLTQEQIESLRALSRQAVAQLELPQTDRFPKADRLRAPVLRQARGAVGPTVRFRDGRQVASGETGDNRQ